MIMKDEKGRDWKEKISFELYKLGGKRRSVESYHKEVEKIMRDTDNKRSQRKKK